MNRYILLFAVLVLLLPSLSFPAPVTVNLHEVRLADLARVVYGDLLSKSYIFDADLIHSPDDLSVNWKKISSTKAEELTRDVFEAHGFELEQGEVLHIRKAKKTDEDLLIYSVRHRASKYLSDMVKRVMNVDQLGTRGITAPQGITASSAPEVSGSASQQFDRSALDQIAYACKPAECVRIRKLLEQLDTPEANVILRAVIYEVATSSNEGTALQIAAQIFRGVSVNLGTTLAGAATLQIKRGGLDALLAALDMDSRFKSLSRPSVRVKSGSTARFSVGSQVPVLGSISYDKNGTPVQSVEYRNSGTIFTVTPDIRAESIDLNVMQELSSFAVTTTGVNNSPTLMQRTANSTLTLHDGEVIVFAGLEEEKDDSAKTGLFGFTLSNKAGRSRSEILLFIEAQKI